MNILDVKIETSRKEILKEEFKKPYFLEIKKILEKEKKE
jgi:uracil DNA glycosylase